MMVSLSTNERKENYLWFVTDSKTNGPPKGDSETLVTDRIEKMKSEHWARPSSSRENNLEEKAGT